MPDENPDATGGTRHRTRRRRTPRRKALTVTAWTAAALVLLGGTGLGYVYDKLNGNISGVDIDAVLGRDRPANVDNGSLDLLVLGSDSRSGANAAYGRDGSGARSDTAMVVHVHRGHRRASVVSIPRDTLVTRPACTSRHGTRVPAARLQMFNSAYRVGGPACAVKTVEALSGIRMDHYVEVDFTGFKKLVDTLGGVDITTHRPIDDRQSRLHLAPGRHRLDGEQALGLVRTRHGIGDGSDLGRIRLQQAFVRALIDRVGRIGLFSDPKQLYDLASTATSAVTTDSELASVRRLAAFAGGVKNVDAKGTTMITLPVDHDPQDPNRLLPRPEPARQVWAALRADRPLPPAVGADSGGHTPEDARDPTGGPAEGD